MNIYEKLIECRKAVPFLKKDNAGFQFKYVSSSQTLGALREAMDANALVLIPQVTGERVLDHTTKKGDHNYFTVLNMVFTWVNAEKPDETIVCPWVGQGLDDGEKGVGKALTYAEKFFLLKFFNIPTDKDDPDANQKESTCATNTARQDAAQSSTRHIGKNIGTSPTPASQVNPSDIPEPENLSTGMENKEEKKEPPKMSGRAQWAIILRLAGELKYETTTIPVECSKVINRVIKSASELTFDEAQTVVKSFTEKRDKASKGEAA